MTIIEWQDHFSVGVASVDHEHRELIDLINQLHETMLADGSVGAILEGLGEIYAQIAAHFALEERIMREKRYRFFAAHKEDHEVLLDDLREIMDEVDTKGIYDANQLSQDLDRWFSEHFQTHDAKLHRLAGL